MARPIAFRFLPAFWPLALATLGHAQDGGAPDLACRVFAGDGQVQAVGPDYRVRFDAAGIDFEPAAAVAAPVWRYEWASARRGSQEFLTAVPGPAPSHDGKRVQYVRGGGVTEVYDVRPDGLEQSFVFERRPEGRGDLVVRGRIVTGLVLRSADPGDGLLYGSADSAGVRVGGVTGVDAAGATVAGAVHLDGDFVEYSLPAAFVDQAAYPLVLDPLVGAAFAITSGSADLSPSVAYDASTKRWCVVWRQSTFTGGTEFRSQLLTTSGSPVGASTVLASSSLPTTNPAFVANVNGSNRFLAAYPTQVAYRIVAIGAATGAMSGPVTVAAGTVIRAVTVAGDSRTSGNKALVLCHTVTIGNVERIESLLFQVGTSGDPVLVAQQVLATEPLPAASHSFRGLCVTRSGGANGRWLAGWILDDTNVQVAAVDANGAVCSPATSVYTTGLFTTVHSIASATRDGDRFALAVHTHSALVSTNENLWVRPLSLAAGCPSAITPGPATQIASGLTTNSVPAMEFAREKYLLAWTRVGSSGSEVVVEGLDPETCVECGTEQHIEAVSTPQAFPVIASRYGGGGLADQDALVVWTTGSIRGRFAAAHGAANVTDMGGSCGSLFGTNVAGHIGDAVIGNLDFQLTLQSPSAPVLALVVGLSNLTLPCGPCALIPAMDLVAGGGSTIALPLPCDVSYLGVTFYSQWLLMQPGGCALFPDYGLSNALRFTIAE